MTSRGRALAVCLLAAVGCGGPRKGAHPLAGRDPAVGFVADAYAATGALVDAALKEEIGNPGRLLDGSDPFCAARLALLAEQQLGTCPNGDCPKSSDADLALAALVAADLTALLPAAADALDAWAAVAVAHDALGLADLLGQVDALPQGAVLAIRSAADALVGPSSGPDALEVLDWRSLLPKELDDGPVGETILLHPPAPRPSKAVAAAAAGVVAAVAGALEARWGDHLPFGAELPALDSAIQTLLRTPTIRDFADRADLASAGSSLYAAGKTLASKALDRTLGKAAWTGWADAGASWDLGVVRRCALLERCIPLELIPTASHPILRGVFDDPNARDFIANVPPPGRAGSLAPLRPHVELRTGDDAVPRGARKGAMLTPGSTPPAEPSPDAGVYVPPAPIPVHWTIHASAPIDHLDLRVHRLEGPDFLQFIYRPNASDQIATTTVFPPESDPDAPLSPLTGRNVTYEVVVVAVDRLGRFSEPAATQIPVRFGPPLGDRTFFVDESGVIHFTTADSDLGSVAGSTVTAEGVSRSGTHGFGYSPATLAGLSGGASVTFRNRDTSPHHLVSVYTPLYPVDPYPTPAANAVGGVLPLDFGLVAPGGDSTIVLPATIPEGYRWTLLDLLDGTPGPRRSKVILTTEPPRGSPTSPSMPIGG